MTTISSDHSIRSPRYSTSSSSLLSTFKSNVVDDKLDRFDISVVPVGTFSDDGHDSTHTFLHSNRKRSKFQSFLNRIGYISTEEVGHLRKQRKLATKFIGRSAIPGLAKSH